MNYKLDLNERPFKAIKAGTKKVEGRTPENDTDTMFDDMKTGDTITFINNISQEEINCEVLYISKYLNVKLMLETEGTKNVLSSGGNVEEGIKSFDSLEGYKDRILKYGVYAIAISYIPENVKSI